jgi:hypothetical protein
MLSEQQVSKELIVRDWSLTHFEGLEKISAGLKELGISPDQVSQLIEATSELKDIDFRAAAFDLLELMKRTGKSSKEAEAYIKELDSKIASKEKLSSDWTGRIEKAKAELRDWEQKLNGERAKFESEQAQNKRTLKEDRERLNRELSESNAVRGTIQETISLKAELKGIGLDLPTFKAIVIETTRGAGISPDIGRDIKEDVKKLGSLHKAIAEREVEEKSKKEAILNLSGEERERRETLRGLDDRIAIRHRTIREQDKKLESKRKLIEGCHKIIEKNKWQFEFFELFISMLLTSPSAAETLPKLELKIQGLNERGWMYSTNLTLAERRAIFVFITMGLYLHSIHCGKCGASFIVNKAHNAYSSSRSSYYCPVCDSSSYTKPDDTFFDLMLSPELGKKCQDTRNLMDIMEKTDPETLGEKLKLLDLLPNEVYEALSQGRRIEVKILDGTC